jgi:hypothetical protein
MFSTELVRYLYSFKLWFGARPVGSTAIEGYKPPDYEPTNTTIDVKDQNGHYRECVELVLKRKGGRSE